MKKNNPRELSPNTNLGNRQMHWEMSRGRHISPMSPDYGLQSDRIHTPSSGFSYSDVESYDADRSMNPNVRYVPGEPNRDLSRRWSEERRERRFRSTSDIKDEDLSDFVYEVLSRHPDIDVSQFQVKANDGVITLRGLVETRRVKRLIEDVVYGLPGVHDVQNRLEVPPPDPDRRRIARSLA